MEIVVTIAVLAAIAGIYFLVIKKNSKSATPPGVNVPPDSISRPIDDVIVMPYPASRQELEKLTKARLLEIAKDRGASVGSGDTKVEVIDALMQLK